MTIERLAVSWQLSDTHGWGIFGLNLVKNLIQNGPIAPLILAEPYLLEISDEDHAVLSPLINEMHQIMSAIDAEGKQAYSTQIAVLHALAANFQHGELTDKLRGRCNIGFTFFERGNFSRDAIARANTYDLILAGSSWNRDFARAAGIRDIEFVCQGVNTSIFHPGSPSSAYQGRFTIFSGGKLELRKGQDLVIAAFKLFHARHPEALLITSWQNHWPETARDIAVSEHISTKPIVNQEGNLMIADWAEANGIPPSAFIDLGLVPNRKMPSVLWDMDAAVFPNRCEGGTNLVAMEAMACGVPCIISANTGHLDIIADDNCFALDDQRSVTDPYGDFSMWQESQVEQILEMLERIYSDRTEAKRRSNRGVKTMQALSWSNQTAKLIASIEHLL